MDFSVLGCTTGTGRKGKGKGLGWGLVALRLSLRVCWTVVVRKLSYRVQGN